MAFIETEIESGKTPGSIRWSLLAGAVAFALDLSVSYVLRLRACSLQSSFELRLVSVIAFLIAASGLAGGIVQFLRLPHDAEEKGGDPHDRAHFESLLGLALSVSFMVGIVALAIPGWLLRPCQ
ncbi:MAG TPA: hypothetical protein VGF19_00310 [Candidatus Acidoferrum sp.]|jgi:hypothetical protein